MTRGWTAALGLAVAMLAGVLASGAATATTPYTGVDVEVTVWRTLNDRGDLYVGARDTGGLWRRHPAALDLSTVSASGRFHRSEAVALTVPLAGFGEVVVEAVVWRSVADPSRLHLSVRREGERWRTVNEPLAMRAYEDYERADAVYVEFAFFGRLPRASVEGPLAIFTVESGRAWTDADGWGRARDVYALDTATGRYWRAFEYWRDEHPYLYWPGGVATAGERLIVWDGQRVRRVWLDGWSQTVLYEGEDISEVVVSPDGAKAAVMEEGGALTVLDAATGEALLRVESQTELTAMLPDAPDRSFSLEGWDAASDRLAVAANALTGESRTGIFTLDGALHLLPPNAGHLSPDFRHAIRPRVISEYQNWAWSGFDVIETASGRTVHPVTVARDRLVLSWRWQPDANRYAWFEMGRHVPLACGGYDLREQPSEEGAVAAATTCALSSLYVATREAMRWESGWQSSAVGPRILDVASGAIGQPTRDEWYGLRTEGVRLATRGSCWSNTTGQACGLFLDGRPVWNGKVGAVGVIELAEPLALFDGSLLDLPRPSANPPAPPAAAEMTGLLFAWSIADGYERTVDTEGNERFQPMRRVMVRHEGTGRSWRVLDYPHAGRIWPTYSGFVVQRDNALRFVTPDGRARTLLTDDRIGHPDVRLTIHTSHSGGKIIASLRKREEFDVTLVALALSSGEELLRVESADPRFEEILRYWRDLRDESWIFGPLRAFAPLSWNYEETAFSVAVGYGDEPDGVFHLTGDFTPFDAEFGPIVLPGPPPAHATVSCPGAADPIQLCAVLLDGEVVGEGRWAERIGFIALD